MTNIKKNVSSNNLSNNIPLSADLLLEKSDLILDPLSGEGVVEFISYDNHRKSLQGFIRFEKKQLRFNIPVKNIKRANLDCIGFRYIDSSHKIVKIFRIPLNELESVSPSECFTEVLMHENNQKKKNKSNHQPKIFDNLIGQYLQENGERKLVKQVHRTGYDIEIITQTYGSFSISETFYLSNIILDLRLLWQTNRNQRQSKIGLGSSGGLHKLIRTEQFCKLNEIDKRKVSDVKKKLDEQREESILRKKKREVKVLEYNSRYCKEAEKYEAVERAQYEKKREEERRRIEAERLEREKREAEKKKRYISEKNEIQDIIRRQYLDVDEYYIAKNWEELSKQDVLELKTSCVKNFFLQRAKINNSTIPDSEQLEVIGNTNKNILTTARAGSGKTSTLINRALFLINHCNVHSSEILILAFNRKAVEEIFQRMLFLLSSDAQKEYQAKKESIQKQTGIKSSSQKWFELLISIRNKYQVVVPHIMTFHSLAYSFARPEESLISNDTDSDEKVLNQTFQSVITEKLKNSEISEKIRSFIIEYFKSDWEKIIKSKGHLSQTEFLKYRKSLVEKSLNGDFVKSHGEKVIANYLFEHNVLYEYERNHWWDGKPYKPDFTIFFLGEKAGGIIIEYFGLQGQENYDKDIEEKRKFWNREENKNWLLVEIYPRDIQGEKIQFVNGGNLESILKDHGFDPKLLSDLEIWERIKDREKTDVSEIFQAFIARCRKKFYSLQDLARLVEDFTNNNALESIERKFLELVFDIYSGYLEKLKAESKEDFDGLMKKGVDVINSGATSFHRKNFDPGDLMDLSHIFIDEFQDFSFMFAKITQAIRKKNPKINLFCVGDNWQAINGFAGSELKYFENFSSYFPNNNKLLSITTNYRCPSSVVSVSNHLMRDWTGEPAKPFNNAKQGIVRSIDLDDRELSRSEKKEYGADHLTPTILRIIVGIAALNEKITLLSRMNTLPFYVKNTIDKRRISKITSYLNFIKANLPEKLRDYVDISTAHKYKGLESSNIILLDAIEGRYPLIHSHWIFFKAHGDTLQTIDQENQRLFYVALTRAKKRLFIIHSKEESVYLENIKIESPGLIQSIDWDAYPEYTNMVYVEITGDTFKIAEILKRSDYRYNEDKKVWWKKFERDGFTMKTVRNEVWFKNLDDRFININIELVHQIQKTSYRVFFDDKSREFQTKKIQ